MIIGSGKPRTGRPKRGSYREGRGRKLCIRVSDEDLKLLKFVCDIYGITKSDFVIWTIREEVRMIGKEDRKVDYSHEA